MGVYFGTFSSLLLHCFARPFRSPAQAELEEEISRYSEKYKSRIATHPNRLAAETYKTINMDRRLKRKHLVDLIKDIT